MGVHSVTCAHAHMPHLSTAGIGAPGCQLKRTGSEALEGLGHSRH